MAFDGIFCALKSNRICGEIDSAAERVIYASPGLRVPVAKSLIQAHSRLGYGRVTVFLDCDEETCRLGYGDVEAIRMLTSAGLQVRQSPGLRFGLFISDEKGWSFTPVALYIEDETFSDETPNAARLTSEQVEAFVNAVNVNDKPDSGDTGGPEIGITLLTNEELSRTEQNLRVAPPVRFDVTRQVRVFQPYIQYVELHLKGCSINRKVIDIPNAILNRRIGEELEARLKTKFNIISKQSESSDRRLCQEIRRIREKYVKSLGRPWKPVILRSKRDEFDKEIEKLRQKVQEHRARVKANLQEEIDKSKKQIIEAFWRGVIDNPPDGLVGQITTHKPDEKIARAWLEDKLDTCFPRAEQIVSEMRLECQFSDVTYETLNQEGFVDALKKAYSFVDWDKPYNEFKAAKEKAENRQRGISIPGS